MMVFQMAHQSRISTMSQITGLSGSQVRVQRFQFQQRTQVLLRRFQPVLDNRLFQYKHQANSNRRVTCQVSSQIRQEVVSEEEQLPEGYVKYETIIVLTPTLGDEERDKQLAKFQTFLEREECINIKTMTRQRQRLAYPMKGKWDGIYILCTYAARRWKRLQIRRFPNRATFQTID
eukprot:TRINITY_DN7535_c0_g1_i3.p2 TRINITY_DN7535_c0_g1~~TRINITY_DN7535_c0_g1_i3.p2  ORF type:complete len:176 (-),score=8.08 TRINITY_DN7535_c0_g1_i3:39-566(-)